MNGERSTPGLGATGEPLDTPSGSPLSRKPRSPRYTRASWERRTRIRVWIKGPDDRPCCLVDCTLDAYRGFTATFDSSGDPDVFNLYLSGRPS